MNIPDGFTKNIAKHFFDKTLTLYTTEESVDSEGWAVMEETATATTVKGNVSFDNLEVVRQDFGIDEEVDITVTLHDDIGVNTIVKYDDVLYKIVKAIPSDSHNLLVGTKWS
jgi:hypothetical protein